MSRGDFSFMRPVRVRSRAVPGRYFFRSDHSMCLVVKEEVLVPGLCGTLVKPRHLCWGAGGEVTAVTPLRARNALETAESGER